MSNPFEFFAGDDEEDKFQPASTENKVKRTHQDKRMYKQQQVNATKVSEPVITEQVPDKIKENAKQIRHNRKPPTPLTKQLGEGHYHDRRSGTGREDRPRKEGGGRGNIGNVKDDLNQDKYIKETNEEPQVQGEPVEGEQIEVKPEEPQALTLEEYYQSKGIELASFEKKVPVKKAELDAEWIKKQKLTLLETKEDKKNNERNNKDGGVKYSTRTGLDENLQGLGFGQKITSKKEDRKDSKPEPKGKGKKVVLNDDDFPSL